MRPALPQSVVDSDAQGEVRIFHTNAWQGQRRGGGHWGGDLPADAAESALQTVIEGSVVRGEESVIVSRMVPGRRHENESRSRVRPCAGATARKKPVRTAARSGPARSCSTALR